MLNFALIRACRIFSIHPILYPRKNFHIKYKAKERIRERISLCKVFPAFGHTFYFSFFPFHHVVDIRNENKKNVPRFRQRTRYTIFRNFKPRLYIAIYGFCQLNRIFRIDYLCSILIISFRYRDFDG